LEGKTKGLGRGAEIVLFSVKERLSKDIMHIPGMVRTLYQAIKLVEILQISMVLMSDREHPMLSALESLHQVSVTRMHDRRFFHTFSPSLNE
jgi:hypothetical protein